MKKIYLFHVYECFPIFIYILYMCGSQKRVLGTLEMELLKVGGCCMGVRN